MIEQANFTYYLLGKVSIKQIQTIEDEEKKTSLSFKRFKSRRQ